jgi:hypothetical protein
MLINGFKFDLRLYVLVHSINPLHISLFNDGLVRLCTTKYTAARPGNLKDRKAHLTNYSVNKGSKHFVKGADGSKRSLKSTFELLRDRGMDVDKIWSEIADIVVYSLVAVQPKLKKGYDALVPKESMLRGKTSCCYEVLGFDVMLDAVGKPWLIEVNHAPSFKGGSKLDSRVKKAVITETFKQLKVSKQRKRLLGSRLRKAWELYQLAATRPPTSVPETAQHGGG